MKQFRFVCLLGLLLLVVKAEAQVDSFRAGNESFIVPVPQDWVMDYTSDGIQSDTSFNTVFRYAVDQKNLYARIGVQIIPKKKIRSRTLTKSEKRKTLFVFKAVNFDGFGGYYSSACYPKTNNLSATTNYTDAFVTPINEELVLYVLFSGHGKKGLLESMRASFFPFIKAFLDTNKNSFESFMPLVGAAPKQPVDSLSIPGRFCTFSIDSAWNYSCNKQAQTWDKLRMQNVLTTSKEFSDSNYVLFTIDIIDIFPDHLSAPGTLPGNVAFRTDSLINKNMGGNSIVFGSIYLSSISINYIKNWNYKYTDKSGNTFLITFSLRGMTDDYLQAIYYWHVFKIFIDHFIESNDINATFSSNGE